MYLEQTIFFDLFLVFKNKFLKIWLNPYITYIKISVWYAHWTAEQS